LDIPAIPGDWMAHLADAIGAAVREFAPAIANNQTILFAVDCHPWHGMLGLALLTADEAVGYPRLNDPAEMAAWRHNDFATNLKAGHHGPRRDTGSIRTSGPPYLGCATTRISATFPSFSTSRTASPARGPPPRPPHVTPKM